MDLPTGAPENVKNDAFREGKAGLNASKGIQEERGEKHLRLSSIKYRCGWDG